MKFTITAEEISQEVQQDKLLRLIVGYTLNGWPPHVTDERLKTYWYELPVEQGCLLYTRNIWESVE